jgi:hypothetical protein
MDDLSEKPCRCGETMGEVIGFQGASNRWRNGEIPCVLVLPRVPCSGKSDWQGNICRNNS